MTRRPRWMRFAWVLGMTLLVSAALLRVTDSVPAWVMGEPRGVRRYGNLDALERRLRTRLLLPAFFPDTLAWPPASVELSAGRGQPTAVSFVERETGRTKLVICQAVGGDHPIPPRLIPPGTVTETRQVQVSGTPATLTKAHDEHGGTWTDLSWVVQDRRVVMRVYGGDADLLRLARSLHRGRP